MVTQYVVGRPRYACSHAMAIYAAPPCQSLAARAVDRVVEALLLRAIEPSALEVSLAVAADVERERAREEQLWQQRLERAHYDVERARRQCDAVEPENRLVARTLERTLEERLGAEQKLEEDHRRARAAHPVSLTEAERSAIRALASALPKVWSSSTTTNVQRKEVVRQLVEEARVKVVGESEQVELTLRWAEHETTTTLTRPVTKLSQLSYYDDLLRRAEHLRREHRTLQQVADTLNAEGWHPARRCETFNAQMVNRLLTPQEPAAVRTPRALCWRSSTRMSGRCPLSPNGWAGRASRCTGGSGAASCRPARRRRITRTGSGSSARTRRSSRGWRCTRLRAGRGGRPGSAARAASTFIGGRASPREARRRAPERW